MLIPPGSFANACTSDRPGSESHRTLFVPSAMFDDRSNDPSFEERNSWIDALCCVYTWVERDTEGVTPRLQLFDDSSYSIQGNTFVGTAGTAMDDICEMSMGAEDCTRQSVCVSEAQATESSGLTLENSCEEQVPGYRDDPCVTCWDGQVQMMSCEQCPGIARHYDDGSCCGRCEEIPEAWDPCHLVPVGSACTLCDPDPDRDGTDCVETMEIKSCTADGNCEAVSSQRACEQQVPGYMDDPCATCWGGHVAMIGCEPCPEAAAYHDDGTCCGECVLG